jgi:cobaltochelatase CobT
MGSFPAASGETVRRTLGATLRALAARRDIEVDFVSNENGGTSDTAERVRVYAPRRPDGSIDLVRLRGAADSAALWLRDGAERWPLPAGLAGEAAQRAWRALAEARAEALHGGSYPGVNANIDAALAAAAAALERSPYPSDERGSAGQAELALALRLQLRERLLGRRADAAAGRLIARWRERLATHDSRIERLVRASADPAAYRDEAAALLHDLGFSATTADQGEHAVDVLECALPQPPVHGQPPPGPARAPEPQPTPRQPTPDARPLQADEGAGYRVFTTRFDEIVDAVDLASPDDLVALRARLDEQTARLRSPADRLARRLQRKLQAWQRSAWEFDHEEGILDCSRLARLVTQGAQSLSFKVERSAPCVDTVVTLLIDNSGSMRGRSIVVAAQVADLLARALERCGVKVEILGFTTRDWRDGDCHAQWLAAGSPRRPGRLNALRHIVYKAADTPWQRARTALGAMLQDGLLKENIDGEALLWAYARLGARREARKILMVVSDGAPIDEATASANGGGYLEHHLRAVIARIEHEARVELTAIGIGHDVRRHYTRALRVFDADELGGAVMDEFAALLAPGPHHAPRQRTRRTPV